MKLMTYNILVGGLDSDKIKKGPRTLDIHEVLNQASQDQPLDFLAVQEAEYFDIQDNNLLHRMSDAANLPHVKLSKPKKRRNKLRYPVAIFSKHPFKEEYDFHNQITRGGLQTQIACDLGEIAICNIHLNSKGENKRLQEIETILSRMNHYEKSIIMGDFNSLSESDGYRKDSVAPSKYRFEVTTKMKQGGFIDVAEYCSVNGVPTFPSRLTQGMFEDQSLRRLDYIWVSPSLQPHIRRAGVIQTEKSDKASDHYPVWAILEK